MMDYFIDIRDESGLRVEVHRETQELIANWNRRLSLLEEIPIRDCSGIISIHDCWRYCSDPRHCDRRGSRRAEGTKTRHDRSTLLCRHDNPFHGSGRHHWPSLAVGVLVASASRSGIPDTDWIA